MSNRAWWFICLAALAVSGVLVQAGRVDANPSLESVARLWGDVLWDTNRAANRLVHVTAREEIDLGNKLAASTGMPEVPAETSYVDAVGQSLVPAVLRSSIPYHFYAVQDSSVNAFSLPGGHVFVTTGLLAFVKSEAELAAVIGHEIAHIDLQHCLDQYRLEAALGDTDTARLADFIRRYNARAYSQQQEYDADSRGVLLALSASYDPTAASRVFRRLSLQEPTPARGGLLGPYFQSHPSSADRAKRLDDIIALESGRLGPRAYYIGAANLKNRTPFSHQVVDAEWTRPPAKRP